MRHSYSQPEKNIIRERVLTAAVNALTTLRHESAIVVPVELRETLDLAAECLGGKIDQDALNAEFDAWRKGYRACIGPKRPSELHVLYLCGPEPLNDLKILIGAGVLPQHVWAVEQNSHDLVSAVRELAMTHPVVRLHPGELGELFDVYPGRFDIVYFDACGSLFSRGILNVLLQLAAHAKLEPMAVLITNFAEFDGGSESLEALSQYFRYRYNDLPRAAHEHPNVDPAEFEHDDSGLRYCMQQDIEPFYSDFVTRFVIDLYRYWIPNTRALALRAVSKYCLAGHGQVKSQMDKALAFPDSIETVEEFFENLGPMLLAPSAYPLFSFYRQIKEANHPWASTIGNFKIAGQEIGRLLGYASMLDGVINGHWSALSQPMIDAIALSWFDRDC